MAVRINVAKELTAHVAMRSFKESEFLRNQRLELLDVTMHLSNNLAKKGTKI